MKKALVTGASGFIGRHTARKLSMHGFRVTGIGHGDWVENNAREYGLSRWIKSDLTLESLQLLDESFDLIVHCVGSGSVGYSIAEPFNDFCKTVTTTAAVLEFIKRTNPKALLVYPSSAGVYGRKPDIPIKEEDLLLPISPYGYHKKISEDICRSYSENFDLNIIIIRFFSVYGEGLRKQLLWDACNKLSAASTLHPAEFFGTGNETRDLMHVLDAVELIYDALSQYRNGLCILNGGTGINNRISDVIDLVKTELGVTAPHYFNGVARAGDPPNYQADIARSRSLSWNHRISIKDGVARYVKWFRSLQI